MSSAVDPSSEARPETLAEAGAYATHADAFQHSLVVLAMGHSCWIEEAGPRHRLLVDAGVRGEVHRQLASFDRESRRWPPRPYYDPAAVRRGEWLTPLLWAVAILAVYWLEVAQPRWIAWGELDSRALFTRAEWWRPFTALFLHADPGHLVSNGLSGMFVFAAVTTALGRGRGWTMLTIAAVVGNVASAAINRDVAYHSIGASTAVFGAVGLLTGRAVRLVGRLPAAYRVRAMFVPLATGVTVLALYSVGGVRVDVGAHLTGFLAGVIVALVCTVVPAEVAQPATGEPESGRNPPAT